MNASHQFGCEPNLGILGLVINAPMQSLLATAIPHRERLSYRQELASARERLRAAGREDIPNAMMSLPPPSTVGDRVDLQWLARRDAILERAHALGYIVGKAGKRTFENTREQWSVEAVGQFHNRTYTYPIGGQTRAVGRIPRVGQTVLMTRGYHPIGPRDRGNRPYIPISCWFRLDPVDA